jgi:CBS domain-containing protein
MTTNAKSSVTQHLTGVQRLDELSKSLKAGNHVTGITVRELLSWFGQTRRGFTVVRQIEEQLERLGLDAEPDFRNAFIEAELTWSLVKEARPPTRELRESEPAISSVPRQESTEKPDPTFRIGRLPAANRTPVSVRADSSLSEARSLMLVNGFSQLPVMQGERTLRGAVSWRSIGAAAAIGRSLKVVKDCMEIAPEVSAEQSLFAALPTIVAHDFVVVRRQEDQRITGLVTTSDLSLQFLALAEPFLLIQEIENHLRLLLVGHLSERELAGFANPNDPRPVRSVSDLTFGEYVRICEDPATYGRLSIPIDRGVLVPRLHEVRRLRNEVMHFDPDPFTDSELGVLRTFAEFLRQLDKLRQA